MLLNKKILLTAVAGVIANLSPASAQTFYQCMPCPDGTVSSKNGMSCEACASDEKYYDKACYSYNNKSDWDKILEAKVGECSQQTLIEGDYIVYLRGGHGGVGRRDSTIGYGGTGGHVEYKFTVSQLTKIDLCAGSNGSPGKTADNVTGGGGGAGSYILIGDNYIVAGGGGGAVGPAGQSSDAYGQGGGGGAVGGGGSGDDYNYSNHQSGSGGSVGPYKGCGGNGGKNDGCAGQGVNAANAGKGGRAGGGYGVGGTATGISLYPGAVRTNVGGGSATDGSATHNSNMSLNLACYSGDQGCATLYRFKY